MRRRWKWWLQAAMVCWLWPATAGATVDIPLMVQQQDLRQTLTISGVLVEGVTYLPVRPLSQALGLPLLYHGETGSFTWRLRAGEMVVTPGMGEVYAVSAETSVLELAHPALWRAGQIYVPLRSLELAGVTILYDPLSALRTVYLPSGFPGRPDLATGAGYLLVRESIAAWQAGAGKDAVVTVPPELMGTYSTEFNPLNLSRSKNLTLAAAALDGAVIGPGQVFSYNRTVGPRWPSRGYEKAIIYQNGEMVEDYGGGVCQVSTTLYNAAVAAGLQIVERHHHSLPVPYVPDGFDATVSYGTLDFRFRNSTRDSLSIGTLVQDGRLTISIYRLDPAR